MPGHGSTRFPRFERDSGIGRGVLGRFFGAALLHLEGASLCQPCAMLCGENCGEIE